MQSISRTFPTAAAGALAVALALPSAAQAQGAPRAGSVEFILPLTYSPTYHLNGQGGSSADVNANLGFGFAMGWNLNNHIQLGGTFNWSSRNYTATIVDQNGVPSKATGYLESSTIGFNATYFLLQGGFTPFVSAGIGSTFVDSNVPNGLPSTGCWYDPWYGQVCSTYVPTKTQTAVSYTGGLGVRFDLTRSVSTQLSYNKMWIDLPAGTPNVDNWRLDFVFRM